MSSTLHDSPGTGGGSRAVLGLTRRNVSLFLMLLVAAAMAIGLLALMPRGESHAQTRDGETGSDDQIVQYEVPNGANYKHP